MSTTGIFPVCARSLAGSEEEQQWAPSLSAGSHGLLQTLQHAPALSRGLVLGSRAAGCMEQPPPHGWGGERTLHQGSLLLQTPVHTDLQISGLLLSSSFLVSSLWETDCEHFKEIQLGKQEQKGFAPQTLKKY